MRHLLARVSAWWGPSDRIAWTLVATDSTGRAIHRETFSGGASRAANKALAWTILGYHVTLATQSRVSEALAGEIREAMRAEASR